MKYKCSYKILTLNSTHSHIAPFTWSTSAGSQVETLQFILTFFWQLQQCGIYWFDFVCLCLCVIMTLWFCLHLLWLELITKRSFKFSGLCLYVVYQNSDVTSVLVTMSPYFLIWQKYMNFPVISDRMLNKCLPDKYKNKSSIDKTSLENDFRPLWFLYFGTCVQTKCTCPNQPSLSDSLQIFTVQRSIIAQCQSISCIANCTYTASQNTGNASLYSACRYVWWPKNKKKQIRINI